jgi:GNAT superfamily N-acetyltransferase
MSDQIRAATPADYPGIVAIANSQTKEPTTVEALERQEQLRQPEDAYLRVVAADAAGTVLGYGFAWANPILTPGHGDLRIRVDGRYGRQGIGTALENHLAAWAAEVGIRALEADVQEDDPASCAWADHRGYEREYQLYESHLALPNWDSAPFAGALAKVQAHGYRLSTLAREAEGEERLRRLYAVVMPAHHDIPGWAERPQPSLELWSSWVTANPHWNPDAIFLAVQGDDWVGLSEVHVLESGRAYNSFTGVLQAHRGHGLALALKVMALAWTKAQGTPEIITENHSLNHPMLAVNRKLGYVPQSGTLHLCRKLT